MKLRKDQRLLVWACVAALALWVVTPLRFLLLPLIYYNTHVHELSHALATILTGGQVGFIKVFADGSGVTLSQGGNGFLVASAGYVGSSIVGGILVFGSRTAASAKRMLLLAAVFIAFALVFFVRGDAVGVATGIGWLAALGLCSMFLVGDAAVFAAQFLGVQQCLTSVQSFLALIAVTANDLGHSDAANMEQATHVPAIVWSLLWLAFSLLAIGVGIKASWANRPPPGSV
jgi:hypothetical protein